MHMRAGRSRLGANCLRCHPPFLQMVMGGSVADVLQKTGERPRGLPRIVVARPN